MLLPEGKGSWENALVDDNGREKDPILASSGFTLEKSVALHGCYLVNGWRLITNVILFWSFLTELSFQPLTAFIP